ncbi:MAG: D-cysteine desulfhydrase family protein [Deltaproteobacteria bacterium]|jgi:D-cysteine desulfhydrase
MKNKRREIPYPARLDLARTPTPLEGLAKLSNKLDVEVYLKRDDLTGLELSGNKVRKLEFLLADALAKGCDTILTCGAAQSNHARATAIASARLGLAVRLLLRTRNPANPPLVEGNILIDRLVGGEIVWLTFEEYGRRREMLEREAESLRRSGKIPYIIPEGGSNALGAWGYVRMVEEMARQLEDLQRKEYRSTTIVHATGSGGTTAGLLLGVKLVGLDAQVAGINVCNDRNYFVDVVGEICDAAIADYQLEISFSPQKDIQIIDGYVGEGYGKASAKVLSLLVELARTEAIILDPVYTGKAFYGMIQELKRNRDVFGDRIIFVHTGGIFGLFPMAAQLESFL